MDSFIVRIERSIPLRLAIIAVVALIVGLFTVPQHVWSALAIKATYYLGVYALILVVAGALGWIAYSRQVFFWVAGVAIVCVGTFHLLGTFVGWAH